MENSVQVLLSNYDLWVDLIVLDEKIRDMELAIKIIRLLGLKNVELRQDLRSGGTLEWDNF